MGSKPRTGKGTTEVPFSEVPPPHTAPQVPCSWPPAASLGERVQCREEYAVCSSVTNGSLSLIRQKAMRTILQCKISPEKFINKTFVLNGANMSCRVFSLHAKSEVLS